MSLSLNAVSSQIDSSLLKMTFWEMGLKLILIAQNN